jgi:hypothetical protein
MTKQPWHESANPSTVVRGASWRAGVWIAAVLVFFAVIGGAGWAFKVATSDIKGQGDAVRKVNSGDNRLAQQAYFEQTFEDIKKADRQLTQLAADKAAKVEGADIRHTGAITYCQGLVADYNAAARKQIAEKFRAADLPAQIDATDTTTDCEATK